mgnify:CR=1 FL=1
MLSENFRAKLKSLVSPSKSIGSAGVKTLESVTRSGAALFVMRDRPRLTDAVALSVGSAASKSHPGLAVFFSAPSPPSDSDSMTLEDTGACIARVSAKS